MNVLSYSSAGTKSATPAKLSKDVFGLELSNHNLLKQAYLAYHSNSRDNLAVTLKRGEVRGGGRKPWRQKGTGRARFGSTRNPIWRSGGVAFGPTGNENYTKKMHSKAKLLAVKQALSLASESKGKLIVIEDIKLKTTKTSELAKLLSKINAIGRTLVVLERKDDNLLLAARNIPELKIIRPRSLNVFDVLNCDQLVFSKAALAETEKWLGDNK